MKVITKRKRINPLCFVMILDYQIGTAAVHIKTQVIVSFCCCFLTKLTWPNLYERAFQTHVCDRCIGGEEVGFFCFHAGPPIVFHSSTLEAENNTIG